MAGKEPKPARITLDYLERYGNGIDGVASEAASEFEREARSVIASHGDPSQWADADRDAIRDDVAGLMERYAGTYGDAVQAIASSAFEGVLEAQGAPDGVKIADVDMSQRAAASSRYWAGSLWGDAPDADAYVAGCSSFVDRHVRHSADYCLLEAANGSRHRKKLRYARVPQGPTCGFCTMLASRGFVYASKESAGELGQFHDGCNCLIVAGFDGLEVEGYDYRGMYERYESCRDSIGPAEDIWRDFQELPPAERDAYGRKPRAMLAEIPQSLLNKIGGNANAFNDYYAHRICREMDTRDRRWLYDGTLPQYSVLDGAIPSKMEKDFANELSIFGWKSEFRPTRDRQAKRTSDVFFVSGGSDGKDANRVAVEFKQPSGNGKQTICHQFEEAAGQSTWLMIDARQLGDYWTEERIEEEMSRRLRRGYSVKGREHKGEKWYYDRATIYLGNGEMKNYFK